MTLRVSVVVPTYKRPELLARCLSALLAQDFDPAAFEVIVADDAADDAADAAASEETRRVVEAWAGRAVTYGYALQSMEAAEPLEQVVEQDLSERARGAPPERRSLLQSEPVLVEIAGLPALRYIPVEGAHGPAAARNCGWRAARGEIIAFTDDDCIPDPGWLRAGVAAFVDGVVGAAGRLVVPLPGAPTDYQRDVAKLERAEFATSNCFYRRDAIAQAGGFDERFTLAWREDSDLFYQLLDRAPDRLVRVPEALVCHPVRPAPWGVSLGQQRRSMFNALLYKKHPHHYRQRLGPVTPWRYYAIVGALLGAVAAGLGRRYGLASAAAAVWALLTAHFCVQRLRGTTRAPAHVLEMVLTSVLIPPLSIFWRLRGAVKFRQFFL